MTGFTGVVWDARTTERLSTDLAAGAGPAPLAEAGHAWASLAAALGDAGLEYGSILDRIGVNWMSLHSDVVHERLATLVDWFTRMAGDAARNAAMAESQAAAVTVARLTMPNLAETALLEQMRDVATATSAVAPALMGAASKAEQALHDQRMRAARVMATYESASDPVARPWMPKTPAPRIVSDKAFAAEQAARERFSQGRHAAVTPETSTAASLSAVASFPYVAPPPDRLRDVPTILAGGASSTMFSAAPVAQTATPSGAVTPPPMAPTAGMGVAGERAAQRGPVVAEDPIAPASSAAEATGAPETWEEVAAANNPVAQHVSDPSIDRPIDSRYVTETLSLGTSGGAR